jgi:hypothetical protein
MDYRVARILRVLIYILVGLLCLLVLYVGFKGLQNSLRPTTSKDTPKAVKLSDYATNGSQMRYVITGPVVANQNFRQTTIIVSANQAVVEVTKGYESAPILSQAFASNQTAFNTFLSALSVNGFTNTKAAEPGASRAGSCATSNKFSYQVYSNGALVQDTWNNNCNVRQGTFAGSTSAIGLLFQAQIPNYNTIVSSVQ